MKLSLSEHYRSIGTLIIKSRGVLVLMVCISSSSSVPNSHVETRKSLFLFRRLMSRRGQARLFNNDCQSVVEFFLALFWLASCSCFLHCLWCNRTPSTIANNYHRDHTDDHNTQHISSKPSSTHLFWNITNAILLFDIYSPTHKWWQQPYTCHLLWWQLLIH